MKKLLVRLILVFIVDILFCSLLHSQNGFYVNKGKTEIKKMECYDFDNLTLKIKITPEMFGYDVVRLEVGIPREPVDMYEGKNSYRYYTAEWPNKVFNSKFTGKNEIELVIFNELDANKTESNISSLLVDKYGAYLQRRFIQYISKRYNKEGFLKAYLVGATVTGEQESPDAWGKITKTKVYKTIDLSSISIPLENRKLVKSGAMTGSPPDSWTPKTIEGVGNCSP